MWVSLPMIRTRQAPQRASVVASESDPVVLRWAAAVRRQDRIEMARAEGELVRRGEAAVAPLARLAEESPELGPQVAQVLGRIRCTASVAALARLHRSHGVTGGAVLRAAVLRALAEIGGQGAREAFLDLLHEEPDAGVRQVAAELAPALLRPEDLASLPPDLRGPIQGDAVRREEVSKLLTELSKTPASSRSSEEWAQYLSPACPLAGRLIAVERLEARADDEALDALRAGATGENLDTVAAAFGALCRLRSHGARLVVRDLVLSSPADRLAVLMDILGAYGDAAYVPLAREVEQRAQSERVKELAERAALRLELR